MKYDHVLKNINSLEVKVNQLFASMDDPRRSVPKKDMPTKQPPKIPQLPGNKAASPSELATKQGVKNTAMSVAKNTIASKDQKPEELDSWAESIKGYYKSIVEYIDGLFLSAKEWLKTNEHTSKYVDYYRRARDSIKTIIGQAKGLWNDSDKWQKILFLIACILIFGLIAYAAIQSPGDTLNNMLSGFLNSLKESGKKIQSSFQQITAGGIRNGLAVALNILFEIFMAPLNAIFGALKPFMDEGGSELLGGCLLCLGVSAAILYYRAVGGNVTETAATSGGSNA